MCVLIHIYITFCINQALHYLLSTIPVEGDLLIILKVNEGLTSSAQVS